MSESRSLFGVDAATWVAFVARSMEAGATPEDRVAWAKAWRRGYRAAGGRSLATGEKGCPRAAVYGLWYLGRLASSSRALERWPLDRINTELGRNAAYAFLALGEIAAHPDRPDEQVWAEVRRQFHRRIGEEPAASEQGQVKVVRALAVAGMLRQ